MSNRIASKVSIGAGDARCKCWSVGHIGQVNKSRTQWMMWLLAHCSETSSYFRRRYVWTMTLSLLIWRVRYCLHRFEVIGFELYFICFSYFVYSFKPCIQTKNVNHNRYSWKKLFIKESSRLAKRNPNCGTIRHQFTTTLRHKATTKISKRKKVSLTFICWSREQCSRFSHGGGRFCMVRFFYGRKRLTLS